MGVRDISPPDLGPISAGDLRSSEMASELTLGPEGANAFTRTGSLPTQKLSPFFESGPLSGRRRMGTGGWRRRKEVQVATCTLQSTYLPEELLTRGRREAQT